MMKDAMITELRQEIDALESPAAAFLKEVNMKQAGPPEVLISEIE